MSELLYLEDVFVGQRFVTGTHTLTSEAIKSFARDFDPQPFHTDEAAAEDSFFDGLAASGWHTAAVTMRMQVDSGPHIAGGMIGAGVEEMRWTAPVRPGDTIRTEIEVVGVRHSQSRPDYGVVRTRSLAFNQRNEVVLRSTVNFLAPVRPTA